MKYFIFQGNDHDCGFAALKMLFANLAKDKFYLYIPKPLKREGYNLNDLETIANDYGVKIESYHCDDDYFYKLKCPCLAIIDQNHVVLIKKVLKKKVVIYDPAIGVLKIKHKDFLCRWRAEILEVEDYSNMTKIPKTRRNILPKKFKVFEAIAAIFSSLILIVSFYLLNDVNQAIFSLLFLGLFATSQLIENFIVHKQIYHFDKEYIRPYFYQTKHQDKLSYLEFMRFKQSFFTNRRSALSSILAALLITFLLVLNDFRNVFVLIALVLIKILENLLFSKSEERSKTRIIEYENKCFSNNEMFVDYTLKANNLANFKTFTNSLKNIFYMVLSFAFALMMLIITGNSGCNYVIFHFVLYFVGSNSYTSVIENVSSIKVRKREEIRFLDSCNL